MHSWTVGWWRWRTYFAGNQEPIWPWSTSNEPPIYFSKAQFIYIRTVCSERLLLGLDRTGHMSFLTEQDRMPNFARLDWTESGLISLKFLPTKYKDKVPGHKFGVKRPNINSKKILKKKIENFFGFFFWIFFLFLKC